MEKININKVLTRAAITGIAALATSFTIPQEGFAAESNQGQKPAEILLQNESEGSSITAPEIIAYTPEQVYYQTRTVLFKYFDLLSTEEKIDMCRESLNATRENLRNDIETFNAKQLQNFFHNHYRGYPNELTHIVSQAVFDLLRSKCTPIYRLMQSRDRVNNRPNTPPSQPIYNNPFNNIPFPNIPIPNIPIPDRGFGFQGAFPQPSYPNSLGQGAFPQPNYPNSQGRVPVQGNQVINYQQPGNYNQGQTNPVTYDQYGNRINYRVNSDGSRTRF